VKQRLCSVLFVLSATALIPSSTASAQGPILSNVRAYVCIEDPNSTAPPAYFAALGDFPSGSQICPSGNAIGSEDLAEFATSSLRATPENRLYVRFIEIVEGTWRRVSAHDVGYQHTELSVGGDNLTIPSPGDAQLNSTAADDGVGISLARLAPYANGSLVTVRVVFGGSTSSTQIENVRYLRLENRWSWYGIGRTNIGVWIPVGLFATDFTARDGGLVFASFPVGVAVGGRAYPFGDNFYFGISAMFNWSIVSSASTATTPASTTVQSFAFGGLLDFGSYVYIGSAAIVDFPENTARFTGTFVLGLGPGLLTLLQAPGGQ
jgi:hypothetical protein